MSELVEVRLEVMGTNDPHWRLMEAFRLGSAAVKEEMVSRPTTSTPVLCTYDTHLVLLMAEHAR